MSKTKLMAIVDEYHHALDHVALDAEQFNWTVNQCANMCKSALDLVNHDDFLYIAKRGRWYFLPVSWYWRIHGWIRDRRNS